MRTIRGVALGTYYAAGAKAAKATPNASQMRGLVYAVKDNRDPPNPKQLVGHPLHPSSRPVAVDRDNAIEYVTAMLARRVSRLASFFGATDARAIALVPVPSSEVTAKTIETARFRTLRLCRALAGVGLGTVAVRGAIGTCPPEDQGIQAHRRTDPRGTHENLDSCSTLRRRRAR